MLWDDLNVLRQKLLVKSKKTIEDYRYKSNMFSLKCPVGDFQEGVLKKRKEAMKVRKMGLFTICLLLKEFFV